MNFGWFKEHPYITGVVVFICGLIAFFILKGGGGGGGTYVTTQGTSPQQTAADMQVRIAQIQAGAVASQTAAALEAKRIESAGAIEMASIAKEIEGLKTAASQAVSMAAIDAQNKGTAAQLEAIRIGSQSALEQFRIQSETQAQVTKWQINAQREKDARDQYDFQTAIRLQGDLALHSLLSNERQNNQLAGLLQQQLAAA